MIAERRGVKVIHGANDGVFDLAGATVSRVQGSLLDAFNIPPDALPFVNGEQVDEDHLLWHDDTLEFILKFGQKGGNPWGRGYPNNDVFDFYPTPPSATEALLERETFGRDVWEPACGDGAISKVLKREGYKVISSDIVDRGYGRVEDFLRSKRRTENIVTNPPYKLAEEFIRKALAVTTNKVAMLLRLTFLESQQRYRLFRETPLESVYVFSRRLSMPQGGAERLSSGAVAYAWFVWRHGHRGEPRIRWLPPDAGK